MLVCQAKRDSRRPNFSVALNGRCVLAPPSLIRGLTPELLKGASFLLSCSAVRRSAPGAQFFPPGFVSFVNSTLTMW